MDAIKINGTMKTKLWKSLRNFGSRYKTLEVVTKLWKSLQNFEVIQHGGPLRSVSQSLGPDSVIRISIQESHGSSEQSATAGASGSDGILPVFMNDLFV
jgi:hypothetical protein